MIAEITKRVRKEQNMTLDAFGTELGVTRQAVYNWEHGINKPDKYWLVKMFIEYPSKDWRCHWAGECLAELDPYNWERTEE